MAKQGGGKQGSDKQKTAIQDSDDAEPADEAEENRKKELGFTLHREFVGMVFAIAIAEVAFQCAPIVNSEMPIAECLPAYSHLLLATLIIAASWVGWGRSKDAESDVKNVFSGNFLELLADLWLVAVYFIIVKGVDVTTTGATLEIEPSLENEVRWVAVAFISYLVWDVFTKWRKPARLIQRGWASAACAGLGYLAYKTLPKGDVESYRVIIGDFSLAFLVLLFRAMKAEDRYLLKLNRWDLCRIATLLVLFLATLYWSAYYDEVAAWWNQPAPAGAPALPAAQG